MNFLRKKGNIRQNIFVEKNNRHQKKKKKHAEVSGIWNPGKFHQVSSLRRFQVNIPA